MNHSCHEDAVVTALVSGNRAVIRVRRAEACHSCSAKGTCTALGGQVKDMFLTLPNTIHAKPGDRVQLTLAETDVVKLSSALYLLPAITLIAGALIGSRLAGRLEIDPNVSSLLGALAGVVAGLLGARFLGKGMTKDGRYSPQLTRIIASGADIEKGVPVEGSLNTVESSSGVKPEEPN